jgi:uncharacterized protein DUF1566
MKILRALMLPFILLLTINIVNGQFDENKTYRFTNQLQGDAKSLYVHPDEQTLQMGETANNPEQFWRIQSLGDGYFRLTNQSKGESVSLDVINDGKNTKLTLAKTGKYSGQYWKIEPIGKNYYSLTNMWQGASRSLDVDPGGVYPQMLNTRKYQGQVWKISVVKTSDPGDVKIGAKVNGGIVFYVDKTGKHGLVCQENEAPKGDWNTARAACEALGGGWRLPTIGELDQMYNNLHSAKPRLGGFQSNYYWSSSEYKEKSKYIYYKLFSNGFNFHNHRSGNFGYRAVRAF